VAKRHLSYNAGAAVISVDDVGGDENRVDEMAAACRVLAVTEGDQGRLYWNGDIRRFRPPQVNIVDSTGAGDIFAAAFFVRLYTRDPWEAARLRPYSPPARSRVLASDNVFQPLMKSRKVWLRFSEMGFVYTLVGSEGGVGKTTTAINLGAYLAYYGQRV
jgi:hypothetical protein